MTNTNSEFSSHQKELHIISPRIYVFCAVWPKSSEWVPVSEEKNFLERNLTWNFLGSVATVIWWYSVTGSWPFSWNVRTLNQDHTCSLSGVTWHWRGCDSAELHNLSSAWERMDRAVTPLCLNSNQTIKLSQSHSALWAHSNFINSGSWSSKWSPLDTMTKAQLLPFSWLAPAGPGSFTLGPDNTWQPYTSRRFCLNLLCPLGVDAARPVSPPTIPFSSASRAQLWPTAAGPWRAQSPVDDF